MKDKIKQLILTKESKNIDLAHALCIGNDISFSLMLFECNKHKIIGEAVQLEAVKQDGDALQYCVNPSEAVQLEAVKQYGDALQYCVNPSEAVQLEAVKQNGYALQYCVWNK